MRKAFFMYFIAALFLFFEMAVQVSPSVMTVQLSRDLNMSFLGLGIMSGFYFYSYTCMQIPSGLLFDRFNPRKVIMLSVLTCVLGCLFLGFAANVEMACIARLLMGFGSAFAFVSVLVVTVDLFPARYFAILTGVTQMLAALGAMSGQWPVHMLVNRIGWRHSMIFFALVGLMIIFIVYHFLKYEKVPIKIQSSAQKSALLKNLKKIIMQSQTWYLAFYACLLWAPMSAFASLWGVPFLKQVDHLSNGQAAFSCSLMWLGLAIASPLLGYFATQWCSKKMGLMISSAIGFLSFGLVMLCHWSFIPLSMLLFLSGAACAGQALSFALVKDNALSNTVASAIAFNNMAVVISGALFQPLIGAVLHCLKGNAENNFYFSSFLILSAYFFAYLIARFCIQEKKMFFYRKKILFLNQVSYSKIIK